MKQPRVFQEGPTARNLFTAVLFAAVIILTVCCLFQYVRLTELTISVQAMGISAGTGTLSEPQDLPTRLKEAGLSVDDVISAYGDSDREALVRAYNAYFQNEPESPSYVKSFPELYTPPPSEAVYQPDTVYLTFDDGPSENTQEVLDILERHGIKATFFVVPKADGSDAELLRKIADAGHTIGIHSATHEYRRIYASVDSFLEDFAAAYDRVYQATGQKPSIFRFPGGSINSYNRIVFQETIAEMTRRGFTYYDWNVEGGEKTQSTPASAIYTATVNGVSKQSRSIVLLHDGPGHQETVKALEPIINALEKKNLHFAPLQNTVQPVVFGYGVGE